MNEAALPLTWQCVLERWHRHAVPRTTVLEPPHELPVHRPQWWANRDGTNCPYLYGNPVNDTGRHLAEGLVTRSQEVFAAFAIHSFLVSGGGNRYSVELGSLAQEALDRGDPRGGRYWDRNAKHVLPVDVTPRHLGDHASDWADWVDAAAATWSRIARDFAVVRWSAGAVAIP